MEPLEEVDCFLAHVVSSGSGWKMLKGCGTQIFDGHTAWGELNIVLSNMGLRIIVKKCL